MDKLFDETFASEDQKHVSRNIWYGYIELYVDGQYGKEIILDEKLKNTVCEIVKKDMAENTTPSPTEINWYLYGNTKAVDAIGDNIRPTIMIRNKQGKFIVRFNISDHDFAVNIDKVLSFEDALESALVNK